METKFSDEIRATSVLYAADACTVAPLTFREIVGDFGGGLRLSGSAEG